MNQVDCDTLTELDAYGHITGNTIPPTTLGAEGCGTHTGYRGKRPPRNKCRTCRALYGVKHR